MPTAARAARNAIACDACDVPAGVRCADAVACPARLAAYRAEHRRGRPPGTPRVRLVAHVLPETATALDEARGDGETRGRVAGRVLDGAMKRRKRRGR